MGLFKKKPTTRRTMDDIRDAIDDLRSIVDEVEGDRPDVDAAAEAMYRAENAGFLQWLPVEEQEVWRNRARVVLEMCT